MQYKYRIEERFLDNGKKEYMPQRCEDNPYPCRLGILFNRKPVEVWQSIAGFQNKEYNRGYETMERAEMDIDSDKAKRQPQVVAVRIYGEDELHGILHPYG